MLLKHSFFRIAFETLAVIAMAFSTATASGAIIAADDFESYSLGQLEPPSGTTPYGGSGWTAAWNVLDTDRARVQIVAKTMIYSAGSVYSHGGTQAMQLLPGADPSGVVLLGRTIPNQTTPVYISFLLEAPTILESTGGNTTDDFLQFGMDTSFTNPRISGGMSGVSPQFFARVTTTASNSAFGAAVNPAQTYLVVLKFSSGFNRADVYINPTSTDESSHTPTASYSGTSGLSSVNQLIFRTARHETGLDWYYIDNVSVGSSFADVVPVPEPSTLIPAALTAIVGSAWGFRTKIRRSQQG